jgi:hypothetical protein
MLRPRAVRENSLEIALSVLTANFVADEHELEARVTDWLAQNPKRGPIFRISGHGSGRGVGLERPGRD